MSDKKWYDGLLGRSGADPGAYSGLNQQLQNAAQLQQPPNAAQLQLDRIAAQRQLELNAALSNYNASAPAQIPTAEYFTSGSMVNKKAQAAFTAVAEQLPFAVCAKIQNVRCVTPHIGRSVRSFEVAFTDNRTISFDNVDTFPTGADIARICLEAP